MVRFVLVGLTLPLIGVAGCSGASSPAAGKPPPAENPQAVSHAWLAAMEEGDFLGMVSCLAPDTVTYQATNQAWRALEARDGVDRPWWKDGPPKDGEAIRRQREKDAEPLDPLLLEYGLTRQFSESLKRLPTQEAARQALAAKIRDRVGFLARFLEVTYGRQPLWRKEGWPRPRVDDLQITGDRAEGKLVYVTNRVDKGDKEGQFKKPISFVRLPSGDWRVVDDYVADFFDRK